MTTWTSWVPWHEVCEIWTPTKLWPPSAWLRDSQDVMATVPMSNSALVAFLRVFSLPAGVVESIFLGLLRCKKWGMKIWKRVFSSLNEFRHAEMLIDVLPLFLSSSIFPKPSMFFSDLKSCAFVWTPAFVPQVLGHDLCRLGYDYAGAHRTMGQWALLWSRYLSTWKDATGLMIIRLMKISFWTVSCVFFLGGRWCFCIFLCSGGRKDADVVSLQFSFWKDVFFFVLFFFVGFVFGILMSGKRGKGSNTSAYLSDPHSSCRDHDIAGILWSRMWNLRLWSRSASKNQVRTFRRLHFRPWGHWGLKRERTKHQHVCHKNTSEVTYHWIGHYIVQSEVSEWIDHPTLKAPGLWQQDVWHCRTGSSSDGSSPTNPVSQRITEECFPRCGHFNVWPKS